MHRERSSVRGQRVLHRGGTGTFSVFDVELPNGHRTELELLEHPGAAAVLPFLSSGSGREPSAQRIVLLHQYRFAAGGPLWEIPAGKRDAGESPEDCARRELREETGYSAGRLTPLGGILTAPGFSDERIHLFRADDLVPGECAREAAELIELHERTLGEALAMVERGDIVDAKTVVALLAARARI